MNSAVQISEAMENVGNGKIIVNSDIDSGDSTVWTGKVNGFECVIEFCGIAVYDLYVVGVNPFGGDFDKVESAILAHFKLAPPR
jgi:hypothetical protein